MGWWGVFARVNQNSQALGGGTLWLGVFFGLGVLAGLVTGCIRKN